MFDQFIIHLTTKLQSPLPGAEAQYKMAPIGRKTAQEYLAKQNVTPRIGSILILFYPNENKIMMPLILRTEYNGAHSGQVSFPGGKFELSDDHLSNTAIRETTEELGIEKNNLTIVGKMTKLYIPPSNFMVHPFVGYCTSRPNFNINKREVEKLIEVDIDLLAEEKIIKQKKIHNKTFGWTVDTPYFEIHNQTVWGATAMIISELKEILY